MSTRPIAIGFAGQEPIEELRQRVQAGHRDFAVMLAGGAALSRKTISLVSLSTGEQWRIVNHIDGSRQRLSTAELWTESHIGTALDRNALLDMSGDPMLDIPGRGPVLGSVLNAEAIGKAKAWREERAKERAENPLRFTLDAAPGALRLDGVEDQDWEPADPSLVLEVCEIGPATVASIDLGATMLDFVNAKGEPQPNGVFLVGGATLRGATTSIELTIEDIDDLIVTLTAIREDAVANRGFALREDGFWTNGEE
jgi:hypothetical protein